MGSNYKFKYNVDIVFCIDATASMTDLISMVKKNALSFHSDVINRMKEKNKTLNRLRIRIIAFRDYSYDGADAMLATNFFTLPDEIELFEKCVKGIEAVGGGDDPEDALEALAYAIRSPWSEGGQNIKRRQIIVVWTDAGTHDLGFGKKETFYPRDSMAKDFDELSAWWGEDGGGYMDYNSKRLILYVPNDPSWNRIANVWDNTMVFHSEAGNGLQEINYNEIIETVANSI